jgi:hypothetical protein
MPLGVQPKKGQRKAITVRVSEQSIRALNTLCTMHNMSQGDVVQVLILDALAEAQLKMKGGPKPLS